MRRIKKIIKIVLLSTIFRTLFKIIESMNTRFYEQMGTVRILYLQALLAECGDKLMIYGKPIIYHPENTYRK